MCCIRSEATMADAIQEIEEGQQDPTEIQEK